MGKGYNPATYIRKFASPANLIKALEICEQNSSYSSFSAWNALKRLHSTISGMKYKISLFNYTDPQSISRLLQDNKSVSGLIGVLYPINMLPTPALLSLASQHRQEEATQMLIKERRKISNGQFDPSNLLHPEIEYSRYVMDDFCPEDRNVIIPYISTLEEFRQLPWVEDRRVLDENIREQDVKETAMASVKVFEMIRLKKSANTNNMLVIGNRRYGSYFVVSPIEKYLDSIGIQVVHETISSFNFDCTSQDERFLMGGFISLGTWDIIEQNYPDVIVVDGTIQPTKDDHTRFSAAMRGYINEFHRYNYSHPNERYFTTFWSPDITERIFIGRDEYIHCDDGGDRELTIASSTSTDLGAWFDDPNKFCERMYVGFTSTGLGYAPLARDERSFVDAVQNLMKTEIEKYLG